MKKNCSCSRWYIYIYIYTERCGLFIRFNPTRIYHISSKVVVSGQLFLLPEMTSRIWIVALMSLYWWGLALFKFKKWWLEVGFDSLFQTWTCKRGKRKRWVIVDECPFPNWKENTEKFRGCDNGDGHAIPIMWLHVGKRWLQFLGSHYWDLCMCGLNLSNWVT